VDIEVTGDEYFMWCCGMLWHASNKLYTFISIHRVKYKAVPAFSSDLTEIRLSMGGFSDIAGFVESAMLPDKAPRFIFLKYNSKLIKVKDN